MKEKRNPRLDIDVEALRRMCVDEGASHAEMCRHFHINGGGLIATLNHFGIQRRTKRGARSPQHHAAWKGGRIVDKTGYILVHCPSHPAANSVGYVREHRLVMEKMIGRHLLPKEVVHHKNGQRDDNRPENLQLFSENSEHLRHELIGKCPNWTKEGRERTLAGARRPRGPRRRAETPAPSESNDRPQQPPDGAASSESQNHSTSDIPTNPQCP